MAKLLGLFLFVTVFITLLSGTLGYGKLCPVDLIGFDCVLGVEGSCDSVCAINFGGSRISDTECIMGRRVPFCRCYLKC
ncbi:hypothetical protein ABFS82_02G044600 [Erythranthe guttata]